MTLGFVMAFGAIIAKLYRVIYIFNNPSPKKKVSLSLSTYTLESLSPCGKYEVSLTTQQIIYSYTITHCRGIFFIIYANPLVMRQVYHRTVGFIVCEIITDTVSTPLRQ